MRTKTLYTLIAFIAVFAIHAAYSAWASTQSTSLWVQPDDAGWPANYILNQDYMLGISYALAGAFTVYAILRLSERNERGIVGMLGGFTVTGFLYFGACGQRTVWLLCWGRMQQQVTPAEQVEICLCL